MRFERFETPFVNNSEEEAYIELLQDARAALDIPELGKAGALAKLSIAEESALLISDGAKKKEALEAIKELKKEVDKRD